MSFIINICNSNKDRKICILYIFKFKILSLQQALYLIELKFILNLR